MTITIRGEIQQGPLEALRRGLMPGLRGSGYCRRELYSAAVHLPLSGKEWVTIVFADNPQAAKEFHKKLIREYNSLTIDSDVIEG